MMWNISAFESLPSTQTKLKDMAAAGALAGTCVQAQMQTGGYGRQGRGWVSPPGNLYLSVLLKPSVPLTALPQAALVAGLALAEALHDCKPVLKWPNDVFVKGRKLAGLILESDINSASGRLNWLALGVGVNVTSAPDDIGTALNECMSDTPGTDEVRDAFLDSLARHMTAWEAGNFEEIRDGWMARAHPPGTLLKIKLGDTALDGYFERLDAAGNLVLKLNDGTEKTISAGEVHFG